MKMDYKKMMPYILGAFLVVAVGVGSAWFISSKLMLRNGTNTAAPGVKVSSTEAGSLDANTKYDDATGDLRDGGIANVGTQHLERDNMPSHYVALTSSVIDLSSFVGKKVHVWGMTSAAKKAGWLMEVAKIQVVQ